MLRAERKDTKTQPGELSRVPGVRFGQSPAGTTKPAAPSHFWNVSHFSPLLSLARSLSLFLSVLSLIIVELLQVLRKHSQDVFLPLHVSAVSLWDDEVR